MRAVIFTVHPDDDGIKAEVFSSYARAQEWAQGLPCGYWIEEDLEWIGSDV